MPAELSDRSHIVVLRTPQGSGSLPVVRVVLGGMASRHALPVDRLDDLQLAVETLFREESPSGGDVILTLSVAEGTFRVTLAGLTSSRVRNALSCAPCIQPDGLGAEQVLRMILHALVDRCALVEEATGGSFAIEMEKRVV